MSYDPQARRDTPLALKLKDRIRRDGPMTVPQYMQACLQDPEHGYYRTETAIGRSGDFITAPEISQIFGELLGLWAAIVWQQMGSPTRVNLIELGPGRGTLMRDALRAARVVPGFLEAARVTLIESNATLAHMQKATLASSPAPITWHADIQAIVDAGANVGHAPVRGDPAIIIGNEYLDCLPQAQMVRVGDAWMQRCVGLDDQGHLSFGVGPHVAATAEIEPWQHLNLNTRYPSARDGDVVEPGHHDWIEGLTAGWPQVAALFIDYGHTDAAVGETLQAVRSHRYEHPLTSPGQADVTMHVDFASLVRHVSESQALAADGPTPQAEFLGSLGIIERASRLMSANPAKAGAIEAEVARLLAPNGMGTRFKAMGLRSATLPPLPGFPIAAHKR
ncbi:MAG: class I SAM-dependent methyltransferase [Hyphomicrobiaceae bacterium]